MNEQGRDDVLSAEDYGVTAREQRTREALAAHLAREVPDTADGVPVTAAAPTPSPTARVPAWNVVATVRSEHFREAVEMLRRFGTVAPTRFYNVLTMHVDDVDALPDALASAATQDVRVRETLSRVAPLQQTFMFDSVAEFERAALSIVMDWTEDLAGAGFHVRVHARGEPDLDAADEQELLGEVLLGALQQAGTPGRIVFDDVDAIIDIETVDNSAGVSLWTRDDLAAYPFLRPD